MENDNMQATDTTEEYGMNSTTGVSDGLDKIETDATHEHMNEHKCKECGKTFFLTDKHEMWFKDHDLHIPTHCSDCIAKKKAAKKEESAEVEE